jgi:hypothetical protein
VAGAGVERLFRGALDDDRVDTQLGDEQPGHRARLLNGVFLERLPHGGGFQSLTEVLLGPVSLEVGI